MSAKTKANIDVYSVTTVYQNSFRSLCFNFPWCALQIAYTASDHSVTPCIPLPYALSNTQVLVQCSHFDLARSKLTRHSRSPIKPYTLPI